MSFGRAWVYRTSVVLSMLGVSVVGCASAPMPSAAPPSDYAQARAPGAAEAAPAPAPGIERASYPSPAGDSPSAPSTPGAPSKSGSNASGAQANDKSAAQPQDPDAYVIYNGEIGMIADAAAIPATLDSVVDVAESFGGRLGGRTDTTVTVRIPSRHFREGMTKIERLADVTRRSVSASDVTAEFKDLQVRLENLRATRKRLEDFLGKAATIADTLTVEKELERVAVEIDTIQGRLRVLSDSTAFSVLTVSMTAKPKPVEVVVKEPDAPSKPRAVNLPIDWLSQIGVSSLLDLRRGS